MATAIPHKKKPQQGGEKLQNIKVSVRVRPLNRLEEEANVKSIVKCISQREILTKEKKFSFDRIFKPETDQIEIYLAVVAPMIPDVIAGYNCTVFAYGQTGSGKTYTMTGDNFQTAVNWRTDPNAGCIPRAAAHIFELLRTERNENSVKVSYLELYNEEVRDLLSEDETILPIFNDTKGSVFIQGLTEVSVHDSEGLCKQLQKGTLKRQTAPTLMNHQSSRSHTVFTITVNTRETTVAGEDILKAGKINLVDLAGSENIARSGCKEVRAVELANINKSLLTLGRVIHALADKSQKHVPYRDSKLTRILQDSLGGHTKTAIIATISPASTSYEETVSTLDYASRARDIKNTPTINEKLTKTQMIQGLVNEIDRLQRDLDAARDKSGFYVNKENYQRLIDSVEAVTGEKLTIEELARKQAKRIQELEDMVKAKVKEFDDTVDMCKKNKNLLDMAKVVIKEKKVSLREERYVAQAYEAHSSQLHREAEDLLSTTKQLSVETVILQDKLEKQYHINVTNETTARSAVNKVLQMLTQISEEETKLKTSDASVNKLCKEDIKDLKIEIQRCVNELKNVLDNFTSTNTQQLSVQDTIKATMEKYLDRINAQSNDLKKQLDDHSNRLVHFESVDIPVFISQFQDMTKNFIRSVHAVVLQMKDLLNEEDLNLYEKLADLGKEVQKRKEEEEVIFKQRAEKDEELLQQVKTLQNMVLTRREAREENLLASIVTSAKESDTRADQIINMLRYAHAQKRKEAPSSEEVDKIVDVVTEMNDETLSKSNEVVNQLSESVASTSQGIISFADTKMNIVNARFDFLMDDRETFEHSFEGFVEKTTTILTDEFLGKVVPAQHEGDTPLRKHTIVRKTFDPHAPREVLLEKFRQERQNEEDKENIPCELNISSFSFESPRTSDSEIEFGDAGDGAK